MSEFTSEISEKPSEISEEMAYLAKLAALPAQPGDTVKKQIARVARRIGTSYPRMKAIWYCEARSIKVYEADALRAYAKNQPADLTGEMQKTHQLVAELRAEIDHLKREMQLSLLSLMPKNAVLDAPPRGSAAIGSDGFGSPSPLNQ